MAKNKHFKKVNDAIKIITNDWSEEQAREFLIKGGVVTVKVVLAPYEF